MRKNKILEMNADELHEVDGVVFDSDSYARYLQHCRKEEVPSAPEVEPDESPAPSAPTFYTDPQHVGWYPQEPDQPPVPIMAGAAPPAAAELPAPAPQYFIVPVQTVEVIRMPVGQFRTLVYGGGSGSGSYLTSFTTSFLTSYRFGSGSGSFFSSGSCIFAVGGYGLELI